MVINRPKKLIKSAYAIEKFLIGNFKCIKKLFKTKITY